MRNINVLSARIIERRIAGQELALLLEGYALALNVPEADVRLALEGDIEDVFGHLVPGALSPVCADTE